MNQIDKLGHSDGKVHAAAWLVEAKAVSLTTDHGQGAGCGHSQVPPPFVGLERF